MIIKNNIHKAMDHERSLGHIPRIYCPMPLSPGADVVLSASASAHLVRVLRMQIGDRLKLFDGQGGEYNAELVSLDKHAATVRVGEPCLALSESPLLVHLGQGISRGDKMDYTLQKAVELGVHQITPLWTARSGVQLAEDRLTKRMQHWQNVIISAAEQCGRSVLPILHPPVGLEKWVATIEAGLRLVLDPGGTLRLQDCNLAGFAVALLVGPESGFSAVEIEWAQQAHFARWRLGPRVLRTETAAPAALVALQCLWGDLG